MAETWTQIKTVTYNAGGSAGGAGYFEIQVYYDSSSVTPTSMNLKFVPKRLKGSSTSYEGTGYYLLVNPGASNETLHTIKAPGDTWSVSSATKITIAKTYTSANFTVPTFWICNTGEVKPNLDKREITYKSYSGTVYGVFKSGGQREGFVTKSSSTTQAGIVASDGSVTTPTISDLGNNTFRISGTITNGSNNTFKSATVYYTTDNTDPKTSSSRKTKTPTAAGKYSFDIDVPNNAASSTIKAYIVANFAYNSPSATASATVKFYTNGGYPTITEIIDNQNNSFRISGTLGSNGTNNSRAGSKLYYTTDGSEPNLATNGNRREIDLTDPNVATVNTVDGKQVFTTTNAIPAVSAGSTTIKVYVVCTFEWGTSEAAKTTTASSSGQVTYHTSIGRPAISITDNGNNTFTITGTAGASGVNNSAMTSYFWGYSESCEDIGLTTNQQLTIADQTRASRTVYAKAVTTGTWVSQDEPTEGLIATASQAIKQYVKPTNPGRPILDISSLKNGRLTIKQNWMYYWSASTSTNGSSTIVGYRIKIYKNNLAITGLAVGEESRIIKSVSSNDYVDREQTNCTIIFDPASFGFTAGDRVTISVQAYTKDGKANKLFSDSVISNSTIVQNAGVVHVKVKTGGTTAWKEGVVWVKVRQDNKDTWVEASTVNVKTSNGWKETK